MFPDYLQACNMCNIAIQCNTVFRSRINTCQVDPTMDYHSTELGSEY